MPSLNLPSLNFNIDGSTDRDTLNNILDTLQLYRKELNFLLMNLDGDNMPSIIGRIEDGEGNISLINQTIDAIQMTVANNSGDIANLQVMADEISASVADNTGNISQLNIKAGNISAAVADNAGNISILNQTAQGIQTQVTNQAGQISTLTQTAQGIQTQVTNQAGQISTLTQTAQGIQTQVTNNKNAISTVTQTVNGIQSTVKNIDDTIGAHTSQIRQLSTEISSKVSVTDYNGREIISLIEQTPYYIKLKADKIDLTGITSIHSPRYPDEDYFAFYGNGVALYENGARRLEIFYDGLTNVFTGYDIDFVDGVRFTGYVDFSDAYIYGLDTDVDMRYIIECYYSSNKCYIDYGGGDRLTVRDSRGDVVGYVDIY